MNQSDLEWLLEGLKALSDDKRLRIICYLSSQRYNVGELAELLKLSEPTVSHHLTKLREVGLVNLTVSGNQRIYQLNEPTLHRLSEKVDALKHVEPETLNAEWDNSWIDALPLDEEDRKVLHDYIVNRRLKEIPAKRKKLMPVLRWLAGEFKPDVIYTEKEVNEIIKQFHKDFASLRRELIDYGYLRRERGGGKYWLAPEGETV
jgi:DNA-binding transcriptional ArsR family regulator